MVVTKTKEEVRQDLQRMLDHNIQSGPGTLEYILRRELVDLSVEGIPYIDYKFSIPKEALNETFTAHGGYVAAMLDEGMGYAARAFACSGNTVKTADISFNCLAPGMLGEEGTLHVTLVKLGRRLVVLRAEMYQGERLVAIGTGSYAKVDY